MFHCARFPYEWLVSLLYEGSTAQFGKQIRREIFRQVKV